MVADGLRGRAEPVSAHHGHRAGILRYRRRRPHGAGRGLARRGAVRPGRGLRERRAGGTARPSRRPSTKVRCRDGAHSRGPAHRPGLRPSLPRRRLGCSAGPGSGRRDGGGRRSRGGWGRVAVRRANALPVARRPAGPAVPARVARLLPGDRGRAHLLERGSSAPAAACLAPTFPPVARRVRAAVPGRLCRGLREHVPRLPGRRVAAGVVDLGTGGRARRHYGRRRLVGRRARQSGHGAPRDHRDPARERRRHHRAR